MDYVRDQILATFKRFTTEPIPQAKLDATRSRLRYSFAMAMDSSDAIANVLAPFISLRRTPETIDRYAALLDTVTPKDVQETAARYFRDDSRTIVTLATKAATSTARTERKEGHD
jgi:zinc protease